MAARKQQYVTDEQLQHTPPSIVKEQLRKHQDPLGLQQEHHRAWYVSFGLPNVRAPVRHVIGVRQNHNLPFVMLLLILLILLLSTVAKLPALLLMKQIPQLKAAIFVFSKRRKSKSTASRTKMKGSKSFIILDTTAPFEESP